MLPVFRKASRGSACKYVCQTQGGFVYRKIISLLVAVSLALLVAACGQQASQDGSTGGETAGKTSASAFPVVVEDSLGRKVRLEERPEQIGSMAPSITESLFAVGAGDRVAGVTTADDYPAEVENIEKIGDYRETNAEKVASLGIDVLFLSFESATKEQAESLEKKTRAQVLVVNPESVEQAIESVGLVGKAVGNAEKARVVEERLQAELNEVQSTVEDLPEPSLFYEVGYDPLYTVGPGSFINDAIKVAGGKNVAGDAKQAYPQYSIEKLLKDDPEYYLAGKSSMATVEDIVGREPYSSLQAVQQNKVFVINDDLVNRPGPRIVDGVREISETIHSDAFGGGGTTGGG